MIDGHGDDLYHYPHIRANFSSNVYNNFRHEALFAHLTQHLECITQYPHPSARPLEERMAAELGVEPSQIMATSGATEAIRLIAQAFRRSRSAVLQPTFAEYADACRLHEHQTTNIYQLESMLAHCEMLWLCCPNNPTGSVIARERLAEFIRLHPSTTFVLDASYAPFTREPLISAAEGAAMPNVVMLHSMTKRFAIPGLRIGCLTACQGLTSHIRAQRMPWSVNALAHEAACWLLDHQELYPLPLGLLLSERERVARALEQTGLIEVWPSDSHILLCRLRTGRAAALKDHLARHHGLLIRDASNFDGLDATYFRIAVQTPEENNLLIESLNDF